MRVLISRSSLLCAFALLAASLPAQNFRPAQRNFRPGGEPATVPSTGASGRLSAPAKLDVATFNLTPHEAISDNVEQTRELAQNIVTVVKTLLYAQEGEAAAAAEGRRLWYDPNTLQLTVTDYPDNIRVVSDYIKGLSTMGQKQRSEIMFLKHQQASDMQGLIDKVTGMSTSGGPAGTNENSVTKTLRPATGSGTSGELKFRDISIRVTRINENDVNNKSDDSVEMIVRTPTSSEDRTIEKYRSDFVEDYEINVLDVRPSGNPGQGSARIEVSYRPQGLGGQPYGQARY